MILPPYNRSPCILPLEYILALMTHFEETHERNNVITLLILVYKQTTASVLDTPACSFSFLLCLELPMRKSTTILWGNPVKCTCEWSWKWIFWGLPTAIWLNLKVDTSSDENTSPRDSWTADLWVISSQNYLPTSLPCSSSSETQWSYEYLFFVTTKFRGYLWHSSK